MLQTIHSKRAPAVVGPYSQAVRHGGTVYLSGQIGLTPETGRLRDETLAGQASQVMNNLQAVLQASGCGLDDIIKVNIYLTDMADFPELNTLYAGWLGEHRPARATVAVAALPLGARVEMDVVAACSS
ncbi:MAG: RidA family protein [Mariprofundaceae bacterium]|nr:RidA family protein [Mariprofundaceae bacterium]